MTQPNSNNDFRDKVSTVFSGYRAEWLGPEIFRLFTEPSYFPQLINSNPCFLVGGRGTGKTTALRCLSYQGQSVLSSESGARLPFIGIYHRVNTNRVRAFGGPELDDDTWQKLFAHYLNLELCDSVLRFLSWYTKRYADADGLSAVALSQLSDSLHLPIYTGLEATISALDQSRIRFEAMINNAADSKVPRLSMQGAPVDILLRHVKHLPQFEHIPFFFLLDEYENFSASQQRVMNTLIKHCGELYSFKVGVREFGLTQRSTINAHEHLMHPADYRLMDIHKELEARFSDFAAGVCSQRINAVFDTGSPDPRTLFPGLSPESEAKLLGVADQVSHRIRDLMTDPILTIEGRHWLENVDPLESYTFFLRADAEGTRPICKLNDIIRHQSRWKQQYDNYKYAYLFTVRKGKRGIRKYYCGWTVYCQLASSNIRILLELVDQALLMHAERSTCLCPITPQNQTLATQVTGQKNFRELESLSLNGGRLARLLLGLGRVFQVMSEDPVGHTPEVNQFHLSNTNVPDDGRSEDISALLKDGVMDLALLWYAGSKLQDQTDVRQLDYAIHPIFAPFFGFSHRRKRKIGLSDIDIIGLIDDHRRAIRKLLRDQRRDGDQEPLDQDLPDQLALFSEFYGPPR